MIIISRRLGGLVPLVGILAFVMGISLVKAIPESWFGGSDTHLRFALDASFAFGCLCIYFLGKKLNDPRKLAIDADEEDEKIMAGIEAPNKK